MMVGTPYRPDRHDPKTGSSSMTQYLISVHHAESGPELTEAEKAE